MIAKVLGKLVLYPTIKVVLWIATNKSNHKWQIHSEKDTRFSARWVTKITKAWVLTTKA